MELAYDDTLLNQLVCVRIRTLNIDDDLTRKCLAIEVDTPLSSRRAARVLDAIGEIRGYPQTIRDGPGNRTTPIVKACWARNRKVHLHFIQPVKQTQNVLIESFNGRLRDERLNECGFTSLDTFAPSSIPGGSTTTPVDRTRPLGTTRPRSSLAACKSRSTYKRHNSGLHLMCRMDCFQMKPMRSSIEPFSVRLSWRCVDLRTTFSFSFPKWRRLRIAARSVIRYVDCRVKLQSLERPPH
jgi:transposase InsO family protein